MSKRQINRLLFTLLLFLNCISAEPHNISDLLRQMTMEQKIGQMMIMGFGGRSVSDSIKTLIHDYQIGGFILLPLSNFNFPDECASLVKDIQRTAINSPTQIPLFIAMDQEGGIAAPLHYMLGATPTPGNMALGASGKIIDTYYAYRGLGNDLSVCGINVNFAPAIDVLTEESNPDYTIRSFGSNIHRTKPLARSAIRGLKDSGIIACAKHFPGIANFKEDTHRSLPRTKIPKSILQGEELVHFQSVILGGVDMIMTVHTIFEDWDPNYPVTLSRKILQNILRKKLKYNGLIITDSMGMGAISSDYSLEESSLLAVEAGCDIILQVSNKPIEIRRRINTLKKAVHSGRISVDRIDESVSRILEVKLRYGLFDYKLPDPQRVYDNLAPPELIKANQNAAINGIVVLKNSGDLLPLNQSFDSVLILSPPSVITRAEKGEYLPIGHSLGSIIKKEIPNAKVIRIDTKPLETEIKLALEAAKNSELIISYLLLTEFSPQQQKLAKLLLALDKPLVIFGLGMPSDIKYAPEAEAIILTHSPVTLSIEAGVKVMVGKEVPKGSLPFPVGSLYQQGVKSIPLNFPDN